MASRDDGVGERAEARRSAVYERPEKLRVDGVGQTRRQDAREGQTDKDTKKHRSFVDQFHEEVFNRKRIAKNYVWRRDRSSNARESPFIAEALALIPDIVRFCGCTASLQRQRNRSEVIKCDRWGSQGYRIIGGLVFLRLVRF